jgi:regulator of RNase E activity RraA
MNDETLLQRLRAIDAYTLADAARRHGTGGVLDTLRPLTPATTMAGRALTVRVEHLPHGSVPLAGYGIGPLLDRIAPGDVLVMDAGGLRLTAMGALVAAHLALRRAAGAVVNGLVRDVEEIGQEGVPVFALGAGITTIAGRGRIAGIGEPLHLNGLAIATGDLVAGCAGGVVAIPWLAAPGVLAIAEEIAESDRRVLEGMRAGESVAALWARHKRLPTQPGQDGEG